MLWKVYDMYYGNMGCQVLYPMVQNWNDFCLRIKLYPLENSTTHITIIYVVKCENEFLFNIFTVYFFFQISGPFLPLPHSGHSMVRLGKGQAILGGRQSYDDYQAKIYSMTCSNRNCIILLLDRELSVPRFFFEAIPIPDTVSGCITGGKKYFSE